MGRRAFNLSSNRDWVKVVRELERPAWVRVFSGCSSGFMLANLKLSRLWWNLRREFMGKDYAAMVSYSDCTKCDENSEIG